MRARGRRVLKPGGQARIMVYHHPSITGAMLWLRYGILRGKSLRQSVFDHWRVRERKPILAREALRLLDGFRDVEMRVVFSPGDLLLHQPSARFQSGFYRLVWKLFPRALVRGSGARWGLFLLITATKAGVAAVRHATAQGRCSSHQRCSTYRDQGRDHEVFPLRKSFQLFPPASRPAVDRSGPSLIRFASPAQARSRIEAPAASNAQRAA